MTTSLFAEIIEANKILAFVPFVRPDSFIFLNVAGTLYAPSNALTDDRWREYFSDRVTDKVDDQEAGQQLINKIKNQMIQKIPKKKIEEITPQLIAYLQERSVVVLGIKQNITPYADHCGEITHRHLLSLGIQFERTLSYFPKPKENLEKENLSFTHGILFTNHQPVGPALTAFLEQSYRRPDHIVMVDHSLDSLESAQQALTSLGISFTGIRYSRADTQEDFDPTIGTIEFLAFVNEGKILSDEEAVSTMPTDRSLNYEVLLDQYIQQAMCADSSDD